MTSDTLMYRNINPAYRQAGNISSLAFDVSSQNFTPMPKDEGMLSVYNGEKFTGKQCFEHFIGNGYKTEGVMGVSISECKKIELDCEEDNIPFNGHSFIDFRTKTKSKTKSLAKDLKELAVKRDWCFIPEIEEE